MPKVSRLEVITAGSRRRWTLEEKVRIVAESFSGHRAASSTARRHGLSSSQLFAWRKLAREGRLSEVDEPGFAAAIVVPDAAGASERSACSAGIGRMEIVVGDVRIFVDASVDGAAFARVVDVIGRR
jgi:transposase